MHQLVPASTADFAALQAPCWPKKSFVFGSRLLLARWPREGVVDQKTEKIKRKRVEYHFKSSTEANSKPKKFGCQVPVGLKRPKNLAKPPPRDEAATGKSLISRPF